jgi:hypothetical protein
MKKRRQGRKAECFLFHPDNPVNLSLFLLFFHITLAASFHQSGNRKRNVEHQSNCFRQEWLAHKLPRHML